MLYLRRPSVPFCRLCFAILFFCLYLFFELGLDFLAGLQQHQDNAVHDACERAEHDDWPRDDEHL